MPYQMVKYHTESGDVDAIVIRSYGDMRDLFVDAPNSDGEQPHLVMSVPYWRRTEKAEVTIGLNPVGTPIKRMQDVQVEVFDSWKEV